MPLLSGQIGVPTVELERSQEVPRYLSTVLLSRPGLNGTIEKSE